MRKLLWLLLPILSLSACLDTKPKVLGKSKIDFGDTDSDTPESFKFNFAFRDTAAAAPLNKIIYLQGATDTKTTIISACNAAGTNCVCEFMDSSGNELEESDSSEITYESTGNYIRCEFDGTLASLAKVRIRNQNSTILSTIYDVDTSLTAQKILGDELTINSLRSIYRFSCLFNFLQKDATSLTNFDCSTKASLCGSPGVPNGDFCLLQANYPYHLYSANNSSNFDQKKSDQLYGGGGMVCGLQIKQFDCAGTSGTPVKSFAIYGEQRGIFELAVQMSAGPDLAVATYGYAAKTSTFLGNTVCPPGLERRVFYRTTVTPGGTWISSNMSTMQASEVSVPVTLPSALEVNRVKGGDCNNTVCTMPTTADGTMATYAYSSTGETEFCVFPSAISP